MGQQLPKHLGERLSVEIQARARVQAARDAGHHALWGQLDAGICNTGGVAHSRARIEARIPRAWKADRCDYLWNIPAVTPEPGDGGERARESARDEWAGFRSADHCSRLCGIWGHGEAA